MENKEAPKVEKKVELVAKAAIAGKTEIKEVKVPETPEELAKAKLEAEKADDQEELKLKRDNLKSKMARLNGGMCPITKKTFLPIDEEIERIKRIGEMKYEEATNDSCIDPKYRFETADKWRENRRWFILREHSDIIKTLAKFKDQKSEIEKEIPMLKDKIHELEVKLGLPKSIWTE